MIDETKSTALNSSTYTAVSVGVSCEEVAFWSEDGSSYYLADNSSGTNAILVPDGLSLSVKKAHGANATLFYAKASIGSPNIALLIVR